ncbi:MAG TPA: energy-coupling factor ABC transporter permease [Planctomycetota bacterium]|nr:energy-coupling factor ABC transporter permease [Planctomycetota bacterium]HRR80722.1 energy-coupling factor ABC transporter permease [Planctomycetota bacterium]HRT96796.1 energy-coupling factor ABC transporter permease [Planctomycetota bacterium]
MHMPNEVLSPAVAGGFIAASAAGLGLAAAGARRSFHESKVPLMGVMGAFVFAAQMVNFQILGATSGHLGGGVLLAILLGPHAAALVMAAILTVQCLIFNDGGLLALGCNVFNMGLVAPYLGYGLYRLILGRAGGRKSTGRLYLASFTGALGGVAASAAVVPAQIALSGMSAVPFGTFFPLMVGIHLLIGAVEGAITFAVVAYLTQVRPEVLGVQVEGRERVSRRAVVGSFAILALLTAGLLSLVASGLPDGLDFLLEERKFSRHAGNEEAVDPTMAKVSAWQERTAPLPDYSAGEDSPAYWTSLAGVLGTVATLGVVYGIAVAVRRREGHGHAHSH